MSKLEPTEGHRAIQKCKYHDIDKIISFFPGNEYYDQSKLSNYLNNGNSNNNKPCSDDIFPNDANGFGAHLFKNGHTSYKDSLNSNTTYIYQDCLLQISSWNVGAMWFNTIVDDCPDHPVIVQSEIIKESFKLLEPEFMFNLTQWKNPKRESDVSRQITNAFWVLPLS
ncbi:hypothetical protein HELRODRAFT_178031 [Helobdella robusta]|uniref:Uncharacterized protein n=1 Tax=Helobdella robusta TaxID=6412 RepID=T1FCM9_HELRO|nr:hypothetical protein HELRODRAFT_178031 [Helobdella robusta]ESN97595.1 hypothetical protein HELRODRAFT_178031 [Helobdella robusta]